MNASGVSSLAVWRNVRLSCIFFFQAEDGIRYVAVTGVQTCALPISVAHPSTIATAIRIGNPARLGEALAAVDDSAGGIRAIDDEGILAAYRMLAQEEEIGRASCRERV